jgi:hypothetical protein
MKATKAHFEFTANLIRNIQSPIDREVIGFQAMAKFAAVNERFNSKQFIEACDLVFDKKVAQLIKCRV